MTRFIVGSDHTGRNRGGAASSMRRLPRMGGLHATGAAALAGLEPRALWNQFEALTKIARPSRHEEPLIEHVRAWAADNGFDVVTPSPDTEPQQAIVEGALRACREFFVRRDDREADQFVSAIPRTDASAVLRACLRCAA